MLITILVHIAEVDTLAPLQRLLHGCLYIPAGGPERTRPQPTAMVLPRKLAWDTFADNGLVTLSTTVTIPIVRENDCV